jgi:hypothetical protein
MLKTFMLLSCGVHLGPEKNTCRQDSLYKWIDTSFDLPLFSIDSTFKQNSLWPVQYRGPYSQSYMYSILFPTLEGVAGKFIPWRAMDLQVLVFCGVVF